MNWTQQNVNSEVLCQLNSATPYQGVGPPYFPPPCNPINCDNFTQNRLEHHHHHQHHTDRLNQQRKADRKFIESFASSHAKDREGDKTPKPLKIWEAKQLFLDVVSLKKELEFQMCHLDVSDDSFESKWCVIERGMSEVSDKVAKLKANIDPLKVMLLKREKVRLARKRKRSHWAKVKEDMRQKVASQHEVIDKLLSERNEEVEAVKREAALKRQADSVLHEVRQKKYEATKMLNTLTALSKLRDLRVSEEEKRGGYCSKQLTTVFNEVIGKFKNLWEKQIDLYKLEEKGLRMMLDESGLQHVKDSEFETNLLEWEKALFGDVSTDPATKILTSADDDLEALLRVRRQWDGYLMSDGAPVASGIPLGWVLPPETQDEDWKKYLVRRKVA